MTTYYFGINKGVSPYIWSNWSYGTSLQSTDFNFAWTTTNTPKRQDWYKAIRGFIAYFLGGGPPPIAGIDLPTL